MVSYILRRWFASMLTLPVLTLPIRAPMIDEATLAVLTIWQEARGESFEGKLAVAEVIRDRTRRGYQSDGTVVGTVLKPYQFSGWNMNDSQRIKAMKLAASDLTSAPHRAQLEECAHAWNMAIKTNTQVAKGALLYHADPMPKGMAKPGWAALLPKLVQIGAHAFYADPSAKPLKGDK